MRKTLVSVAATVVQLMPVLMIAGFLFLGSKPPDNPGGMPGVAVELIPGARLVFPFSIALGAIAVAACFSRIAAGFTIIAMLGVIAYAIWFLSRAYTPSVGVDLIALSLLSIAAGVVRLRWANTASATS